jgi:hypothetical protein
MTHEVLVWDSSGGHALFWWRAGEREVRLVKRYERRCFATEFPRFLDSVADTVTVGPDTTVYLGAGPGSFTGLKSGIAVIGGFLYARGVTTVRLVSSLDLLSLRVPQSEGAVHVVVVPLNDADCFLTAFVWERGVRRTVLPQRSAALRELPTLLAPFGAAPTMLIADRELSPALTALVERELPGIRRSFPGEEFRHELMPTIPVRSVVDLRNEPLMLQYMASPADLQGDHASFNVAMN